MNSAHLEFSPTSHPLLVPPLLEAWVLEEQYVVNLKQKSFPHAEKLIPGSEKLLSNKSIL